MTAHKKLGIIEGKNKRWQKRKQRRQFALFISKRLISVWSGRNKG